MPLFVQTVHGVTITTEGNSARRIDDRVPKIKLCKDGIMVSILNTKKELGVVKIEKELLEHLNAELRGISNS